MSYVVAQRPAVNVPDLRGLGYYIEIKEWLNAITLKYNYSFSKDVETVYKRMDYNASVLNVIWWNSTYSYEQTRIVIQTYMNGVLNGLIPEYSDPDTDGKQTANKKKIWEWVSTNAAQPIPFVQLVMFELYWASKDGSLSTGCWLQPATCKASKELRDTIPESAQGDRDSILSALKWVAIIAGVGVAGFYLMPLLAGSRR